MSSFSLPDAYFSVEDPLYPSSDGKPMAENDWQLQSIYDAYGVLRQRYQDRPDVYVSADLLIYYEKGNPAKRVAPDVFVVLGAPNRKRMVYKVWEEHKVPDFVLEVASKGTWTGDRDGKRVLYERLGVREYWRLDPQGEFFTPPLQALVLLGGRYAPLPSRLESGRRFLRSLVLGLDLFVQGGKLRFRDLVTGQDLLGHADEAAAREKAVAAHKTEAAARKLAEARVAELEARLKALGAL